MTTVLHTDLEPVLSHPDQLGESPAYDAPGGLLRLDPDGAIEVLLADVGLPNGMDWSPDGQTFYFVDSTALTIDAFDFDGDTGRLSHRRTLSTIERGIGGPNGLAVD